MVAQCKVWIRSRAAIGWFCVGVVSLLIAVAVGVMAPSMAPIQPGTSAEFWECATTVRLPESSSKVYGHAYGPLDGWYYYEVSGRDGGFFMHGNPIHRVPEAEVVADFDRVVKLLQSPPSGVEYRERVRAGYRKWNERPDNSAKGPTYLLSDLRRAREAELGVKDPSLVGYHYQKETQIEERHIRSRWYWSAIAFEWLFLSGLVLFAAWPALKGLGWKRWAIHLGLSPLLFMLPAFLGYATYSFTSAGPTGGIVYPFLLEALPRSSCNEVDLVILRHLPPLLEPMSSRLHSPAVLSGRGMPGPTNVLLVGVFMSLLVAAIHIGHRKLRQGWSHKVIAPRVIGDDLA